MPTILPRPEARAAHMDALRLIGHHRTALEGHACEKATCTRPAHWRVYRDANPRLAEVLIICGAYEVYEAVSPQTGYPVRDGGYAVLERADGPAGTLYVDSARFGTWPEAIRYACEKSIENIAQEVGEPITRPAPVPGIAYAAAAPQVRPPGTWGPWGPEGRPPSPDQIEG